MSPTNDASQDRLGAAGCQALILPVGPQQQDKPTRGHQYAGEDLEAGQEPSSGVSPPSMMLPITSGATMPASVKIAP
jgi:hypothetical protein